MRVLVVTATLGEVRPIVGGMTHSGIGETRHLHGRLGTYDVDVLVAGLGMVPTATWCSRALAGGRYDAALNLGVCGSFSASLPPGTVVHVVSDCFAELGAEDGDRFIPLYEMSLLEQDEDMFPFKGALRLVNEAPAPFASLASLPSAMGITVNTVHGNDKTIAQVVDQFAPDVESMEGAAFMYSCLVHRVPFAQVRAVSNMVERRNRAAWKLDEAIANLGAVARQLLEI